MEEVTGTSKCHQLACPPSAKVGAKMCPKVVPKIDQTWHQNWTKHDEQIGPPCQNLVRLDQKILQRRICFEDYDLFRNENKKMPTTNPKAQKDVPKIDPNMVPKLDQRWHQKLTNLGAKLRTMLAPYYGVTLVHQEYESVVKSWVVLDFFFFVPFFYLPFYSFVIF